MYLYYAIKFLQFLEIEFFIFLEYIIEEWLYSKKGVFGIFCKTNEKYTQVLGNSTFQINLCKHENKALCFQYNDVQKKNYLLFCSPLQFSFLGQIYKNRSTKRQKRSASQKVSKSSDFDHQQQHQNHNKIEYKRQESNGSESQETNSKLTLLSTQVILEN